MYRKDYFLKLLQQFTMMLSKLMGLKTKGDLEEAKKMISEAYKEYFKIDSETVQDLPLENISMLLREKYQLNNEQLELIARLMYEESDLVEQQKSKDLLNKSLSILEFLNVDQKLFSFEREDLIKRIKSQMN